jgi:hypothetical protein
MKKNTLIFLMVLSSIANAQILTTTQYLNNKKANLFIPNKSIKIVTETNSINESDDYLLPIKTYLLNNINELKINNGNVKLDYVYESTIGKHYQFKQTYNGSEVYQSNLKITVNANNEIVNIINDLSDLRTIKLPNGVLNEKEFWVFNGSDLIPSTSKTIGNKEQLISLSNILLHENIKSVGKGKKDTSVIVKLFNPDPLTTARSPYVAPYLNYNKQDSPAINNERKNVQLNLIYDDEEKSFIAENKYVLIQDIFGPTAAPFSLKNKDSLVVTRNTDIFKQEMAMYHIDQYQNNIQNIGINNLQTQIKIDPIGGFGEDSRFEYSGPEPYLIYAVGGIPDAEDADVITHEYTHAMGFYIAPNTIEGEERIGIDEGNCDIMAAIYSRKLSDYEWRTIFNWDGNQTWSGRTTLNTKNYIDNYVNERYALSSIWSAAVTDFAEQIGLDTTTKLLFASMASYQTNMTIPTFAQLFIQADSILFNKQNAYIIKNSFFNRKLIPSLSINENFDKSLIKILNSQGFASSNESLVVQIPSIDNFDITIFNLQGKVIIKYKNQSVKTEINSNLFTQGIYILNISSGNKSYNYKIAKY